MNIAIVGYGKMGHIIETIAQQRGHSIVCRIDTHPSPQEGVWGREGFDSGEMKSVDVAIEFSVPQAAGDNVRSLLERGIPVVSGTTGWDVVRLKEEFEQTTSSGWSLIWSSNFSLGVNLLFALNSRLASMITPYPYLPSITETHHIHKIDQPSGTAKTLAKDIEMVLGDGNTVPINSIRQGEVPGIHTIQWESNVDILTLSHSAKSRDGFALGAVIASEWIVGKTGFHTMQEVLGL